MVLYTYTTARFEYNEQQKYIEQSSALFPTMLSILQTVSTREHGESWRNLMERIVSEESAA